MKKIILPIVPKNNKVCCRVCGKLILFEEFKKLINIREFLISGFCQKCQDKTFK